jgi:hypothetical protein
MLALDSKKTSRRVGQENKLKSDIRDD